MRIQKRKPRAPQDGSALIMAIVFIALLAIVMLPIMSFMQQTAKTTHNNRASQEAFYAAEAGLARAASYIFAKGGGAATGFYDSSFAVDSAHKMNPFASDWVSMAEGISAAATGQPAVRVRIWQDKPSTLGTWRIEAVGRVTNPKSIYRKITAQVRPGSFARYAFFNTTSVSTMDGNVRYLSGGEVFNGPVHSNQDLYMNPASSNHLIFNSDVSVVGSESYASGTNSGMVDFNGKNTQGADYVELPSDLSILKNAATSGGVSLPAADTSTSGLAGYSNGAIVNYQFTFNSSGTVTISNLDASVYAAAKGKTYTPMTVTIANTNGAFVVNGGNVFVQGTLKGRATVAAVSSHSSNTLINPTANTKSDGNLIINGNVVYSTHPTVGGSYDISDSRSYSDQTVTDTLGLIAERNFALDHSVPANCIVDAHIMLTGQATANPDVRTWTHSTPIAAAINQDGAFFIEDGVQIDLSKYWTGINDNDSGWKNGDLYLTGGVVHFLRGQTSNGVGYDRHYVFDQRLMKSPPPFYPLTPSMDVLSWTDVSTTTQPS